MKKMLVLLVLIASTDAFSCDGYNDQKEVIKEHISELKAELNAINAEQLICKNEESQQELLREENTDIEGE